MTPDVVVTCDHVVVRPTLTSSGLFTRQFSNNVEVQTETVRQSATIISSATDTKPFFYDYALLRVQRPGTASLPLANYKSVAAGENVLILGYPLQSDHIVATRAMVASTTRMPSHQNRIVSMDIVELDGAVNKGNSGGPAISSATGRVVGIVSVRYGNLTRLVEQFRQQQPGRPTWTDGLLDIFEVTDTFLNPGLGYAVSTSYVLDEMKELKIT